MFELALTVILFGVVQNDFVSEDHATRIEFTRSCIRFALVLLGVMCIMHSKRVLDILRNFLFRTRANSMDAAMFRIIVAFILLEKVGFSMPYWRSDFIIPPETLQNPPLSFRSTLDVCPMSVCLQPGLQISFVSTLFLLFGLFTSLSAFSMYLCYCNIFKYSSSLTHTHTHTHTHIHEIYTHYSIKSITFLHMGCILFSHRRESQPQRLALNMVLFNDKHQWLCRRYSFIRLVFFS